MKELNNFVANIESIQYKAQCTECFGQYPNARTRTKPTRGAMHSWKKRHMALSGHAVRTAITYVRLFKPKEEL